MKKIGTLAPGAVFAYAKKQFVVMEVMDDGVFCILAQSEMSVPFHNMDDAPRNNYVKSSLRETIEGPWLKELLANGGSLDDMVPFDVDLRPTDQSEGYGTLKNVLAAPLTLWQYGKYKDIIPLNEDDWWWLVTPWACPWLRSPYTSNTNVVWYVLSSGSYGSNYCTHSCGVRPALKLNSDLLVSVDGEDGEDLEDGWSDGGSVDLSKVDTASILKEIERRIAVNTCNPQQGDGEGETETGGEAEWM